jgi:hypothetical protein
VATSSTSKAAKLARKGPGQRVRFQGGTIFPLAVAIVLVLGLGLIVYARQTVPAADDSPPTINDHWHAAYGFYLCDQWYQLSGNLEERNSQGQFTNTDFLRSGIHSHDDGVIHWHPYTSLATGRNATFGVFLDSYGVELSDDKLVFPDDNILGGQQEWDEDETQCDGEDAQLSVRAWQKYTDTDDGVRYISNMDEIHVDQDGMVFAVYFTADDVDQSMPPWAAELPALGAVDLGQIRPEDLLQGDTSVVTGDSTPTEDTTTDDTTTDDTTADDTTTDDTTTDDTTPATTGG